MPIVISTVHTVSRSLRMFKEIKVYRPSSNRALRCYIGYLDLSCFWQEYTHVVIARGISARVGAIIILLFADFRVAFILNFSLVCTENIMRVYPTVDEPLGR